MASGWLADVVPNAPILSSWGNAIRDRTITVFDTPAQRDAQLPNPTPGMACYVLSTHAFLIYYDGTTKWAPPWSQPWGTPFLPKALTGIQVGAAVQWVPNSQIVLTLPIGRMVRYVVQGTVANGTGAISDVQFSVQRTAQTAEDYMPYRTNTGMTAGGVARASVRVDAVFPLTQVGQQVGCLCKVMSGAVSQFESGTMYVEDLGPAPAA